MRKTITLFKRNYNGDRQVYNEVTPGAEWVLNGEGVATLKVDGTCTLVENGQLFKRFELKAGKCAPEGFRAAQAPDPITGDTPGWLPVTGSSEDRWHREAFAAAGGSLADGTYELVGPKIQGNPGGYATHQLVRHGVTVLAETPRTFDGLRLFFEKLYAGGECIEGVVFWREEGNPNSDMVKIKARDFGIRPARKR
jgi:hypothetical protein